MRSTMIWRETQIVEQFFGSYRRSICCIFPALLRVVLSSASPCAPLSPWLLRAASGVLGGFGEIAAIFFALPSSCQRFRGRMYASVIMNRFFGNKRPFVVPKPTQGSPMRESGSSTDAPEDVEAHPARFAYPSGGSAQPPPLSTLFVEQLGETPVFPTGDPSMVFLPVGPHPGGMNTSQLHAPGFFEILHESRSVFRLVLRMARCCGILIP